MPDYSYVAKNDLGMNVYGHLNATDEADLADRLLTKGLFLIEARKAEKRTFSFERITRKDLITLTVHLHTVLSAGVDIMTGLEDLINQTEKERFRFILEDIKLNVEAGVSLSDALEKHPKQFSELYVNMIRAGEATGNVESVMADLVDFMEWQEELSGRIKEALVYPAILLSAVIGLLGFLFTFVLPRFQILFSSKKVQLPFISRMILKASGFVSDYWYIVLLSLIALLWFIRYLISTENGRYLFDKMKLKLPVFGELIRKICLSRFSHNFAALLKAGIDVPKALNICEKIVGNDVLSRAIRNTFIRVQEGEQISKNLAASGEFPPLVIRMVAIGERTGSLEKTLGKVNQYYDREIPATIRRVFAIMEPTIIVLLGVVVVTVAISVFLPMYQLVQLASVHRGG